MEREDIVLIVFGFILGVIILVAFIFGTNKSKSEDEINRKAILYDYIMEEKKTSKGEINE